MKYLGLLSLIFGLILFGCNLKNNSNASIIASTEVKESTNDSKDKDEIQTLIRQMLKWADSNKSFDLLPVLSKDSICVGFDFDKLKRNLEILKKTGFFADEFIDNYKQIIQTLDKKIKNKEIETWNIYELPTFNFANDVYPWCLCQDIPFDNPNPYDFVTVDIINFVKDKAELNWKWGNLKPDYDPSWKKFSYRFRVVKENNKWEISYLQGFDYKESIKLR
jgi:hypothetical protein